MPLIEIPEHILVPLRTAMNNPKPPQSNPYVQQCMMFVHGMKTHIDRRLKVLPEDDSERKYLEWYSRIADQLLREMPPLF